MARHLALLGSINVGGNRLKMGDLREALSDAWLAEVETVVASGNVLFAADGRSVPECEADIATLLDSHLSLDVMVTVRTRDEVAAAIDGNPFHGDGEDRFVHTHFLEHETSQARFEQLVADHEGRGPERLALGDRMLFIDYVAGTGTSKLTAAFIERRLETRGTARNMRSLKRILEKME
ncbi:MAG: DUF1697 domain-containing protein [Sphingomonadaceae bacterium]